jgi:hypothetical protein
MKRTIFAFVPIAAAAGIIASLAPLYGEAAEESGQVYLTEVPGGYRDF